MKKLTYLVILVIIILLKSCAPAYIPNIVNTPLLGDMGEFQAAVYTGTSILDAQMAFAVTDNIGIMLNGSFANQTRDSANNNYHKHQFIEFAPGYHKKISEHGRFETYVGYGTGKVNALFDNALWHSYSNVYYNRIFIQPAIGTASDFFDGSLAMRLAYVELYQENKTDYSFFFEPAATAKIGFKAIKLVMQFGFSVPVKDSKLEFDYQPFIFGFGLHATLGRK